MDLRAAPRAVGALPLRYHLGGDVDAWLAGAAPPDDVHTPDPLMNFNHLGFAFDGAPTCGDSDILLLELSLGELGVWRAAAIVVRVSRVPIDERDDDSDATHRIACQFIAHAPGGEEALRTYATRVSHGETV